MCKVQITLFIILTDLLVVITTLQFLWGECPVYFEEPCTSPGGVKFFFISTTHFYQIDPLNLKLPPDFNVVAPMKILIHGYGGLDIDRGIKNITRAYRKKGYNIIVVDWGALSSVPCYMPSYLNTWHVGQCVALLGVSLIPYGLTPNFLHLIGFSLGAHVAGLAGTTMKNLIEIPFGRITGLDPALPFFATLNNDFKLDNSDASFVDIIHTSAGSLGKIEATGHVDFYMNGGFIQPFCYNAPYPPVCSHVMSGIYFAESIARNESYFVGRQCENVANYLLGFCRNRRRATMGEFVDMGARGSYFVETAARPPFALGYT